MEKKKTKYKIKKEKIPEFDLSPNIEKLQKQVDKNPKSNLFLQLAKEYHRSKMTDEAIFILVNGLQHNPNNIYAKITLAKCYLDQNERLKAKQVIDELPEEAQNTPAALRIGADISFREGDFNEARGLYRKLYKINPMDEEASNRLKEMEEGGGEKIELSELAPEDGEMEIERASGDEKPDAPVSPHPQSEIPQSEELSSQQEAIQPEQDVQSPAQQAQVFEPPQQLDEQQDYSQYQNAPQEYQQTPQQPAEYQMPEPEYVQQATNQGSDSGGVEHGYADYSYQQGIEAESVEGAPPEVTQYDDDDGVPYVSQEVTAQPPVQSQEQVQPIDPAVQYADSQIPNVEQPVQQDDAHRQQGYYTGPPTEPLVRDYNEGQTAVPQQVDQNYIPQESQIQDSNPQSDQPPYIRVFEAPIHERVGNKIETGQIRQVPSMEGEVAKAQPPDFTAEHAQIAQPQIEAQKQVPTLTPENTGVQPQPPQNLAEKSTVKMKPIDINPLTSDPIMDYDTKPGGKDPAQDFYSDQIPQHSNVQISQASAEGYSVHLAELYEKQGHLDKAAMVLRKMLQNTPNDHDLITRLQSVENKMNQATDQS